MNESRETGNESLAPTVLSCWLQAGGLVVFAVVCWVVVTVGAIAAAGWWVFSLPTRIFSKWKVESRKSEG